MDRSLLSFNWLMATMPAALEAERARAAAEPDFDSSLPDAQEVALRHGDPRLRLRFAAHSNRNWQADASELARARPEGFTPRRSTPDALHAGTPLARFGRAHCGIGQVLWDHRAELRGHCLHAFAKGDLIAVLDPMGRVAHLAELDIERAQQELVDGQLRPAAAAAKPRKGFETVPLQDVLWWYGLHSNDALTQTPDWVKGGSMVLKHFPQISPALLETRHLAILYLFGAGPLTYGDLWHTLDGAARPLLCADLAAMVFTGCLAQAPEDDSESSIH